MDLRYEVVHRIGELYALSRRYPLNASTAVLNTDIIEHGEQKRHSSSCIIVTRAVMAVSGVASAHDNAVSSLLKSSENEHRVYTAGARYADDLYVRGI